MIFRTGYHLAPGGQRMNSPHIGPDPGCHSLNFFRRWRARVMDAIYQGFMENTRDGG